MTQKENDEIKNLKNEKEQEKLSQRKKEIQEIRKKIRNLEYIIVILSFKLVY